MTCRHQIFELLVRTPAEAASLVAGGCGCPDENRGVFAIADPDAPAGDTTWSGVIGTENELTGDGRMIEANALRWESLPLPLRFAPEDIGGHDGAQVVGRILTVERKPNGDLYATGDFDMGSEIGREAYRQVSENLTTGVSMDLDAVSFEIRVAKELLDEDMFAPPEVEENADTDEEGRVTVISINADDEIMVTTDGRVRGATIVAMPAFIRARLAADSPGQEAAEEEEAPALVAAASIPMQPPASWFVDPALPSPVALRVTEEGRIYGHLAVWGTCHTAYTGQCVEPPHSPSDYAYFRTGAVLTAEGDEVAVGNITLDTLHAGRTLTAVETLSHYEHTGRAVADVVVGEDAYGIWVAGALRPGLPEAKVRALRAAPLSGDWRRIGRDLELVAALAVNSPGFPVPRPAGLVAGGAMMSLVASGVVDPGALPDQPELPLDEDAIVRRTVAEVEKQFARKSAASALAARTRKPRAAALAARVKVG